MVRDARRSGRVVFAGLEGFYGRRGRGGNGAQWCVGVCGFEGERYIATEARTMSFGCCRGMERRMRLREELLSLHPSSKVRRAAGRGLAVTFSFVTIAN